MRIAIGILLGVILLVGIGYGALAYMNRPISKEAVTEKIEEHLAKVVKRNGSLSSALLTIYSNQTGYFEQFATGTKNRGSDEPVRIDSPYHAASVGKMMCAAVYGILADEGKINFDDKISSWLDTDTLKRLFVIDGTDYSEQVTLRHLLTHTSGAADYFEGPVKSGHPMLEVISSNPDLSFSPQELIAFTRDNQDPVGKPGQQFYYSDTGYILLGLILEEIEKKSYADILDERIFKPLGMNDSYLYQDESSDIVGIYLNGMDYSDKAALSVDWSGGGVITTMNDLLVFMKAFVNGELLSDEVYKQMTDFHNRYRKGIYAGMGMMYFDFSKLSFLLGLSAMTDVYGGIGATGTYVLYDEDKETFFIANFGSLDFAEKSIEELVKIRMIYDRMKSE
ncbi:serine hydrolase domain-containing protein [Paenibacillus gorillae]|uniref:serine hydrolase domain-containing protein n=1 Tax=Paenibacillus gorillae TaxID=1243662 RepID=UPI0004B8E8B3|nr:serine hydrolase domain-containing protein [Paenibacillus gorillae]